MTFKPLNYKFELGKNYGPEVIPYSWCARHVRDSMLNDVEFRQIWRKSLLMFSQHSGLKFPADFLWRIKIFGFNGLLNIFYAVSADNRSPHG